MPGIRELAEKAAGYIAGELGLERQKEKMLTFGLELLLGSALEFALIMALASLFGIFRETLILVLTAGILRLVSGGEHCQAYYRCLIGGTVFFLLMGWLVKWLNYVIAWRGFILLTAFRIRYIFNRDNSPNLQTVWIHPQLNLYLNP